MKYVTIVPLIGGMTLGNIKATRKLPIALLSYKEFQENDKHLVNYLKTVPYLNAENKAILNKLKMSDLDFVSTVCPCAGLSTLSSGNKEVRASKNAWMFKTAENVLENIKPKVFWGENAPGLFTKTGTDVRNRLFSIADRFNYSFSLYKTNTLLHGIPQYRERTFYFFWRDSKAPILKYIKRDRLSLVEFLHNINKEAKYYNTEFQKDKFVDTYFYNYLLSVYGKDFRKRILNGKNNISIIAYLVKKDLLNDFVNYVSDSKKDLYPKKEVTLKHIKHVMYKLSIDKGYWTNTCNIINDHIKAICDKNKNSIHPIEDRFLNVRELFALMGLPNNFCFKNDELKFGVLAQNVPVNTAADMTKLVVLYLKNKLSSSGKDLFMQNNIKQIIV